MKTIVELTSGSGNWTVPSGVNLIDVVLVAAGGGSPNNTYLAGGGGEVVLLEDHKVIPEASIPYVVGAGTNGAGGGSSSFNGISAQGGYAGGSGGGGGSGVDDKLNALPTAPNTRYTEIFAITSGVINYRGIGGYPGNNTNIHGTAGKSIGGGKVVRFGGGGGGGCDGYGGGNGGYSCFANGGTHIGLNAGGGASWGPGANGGANALDNTGAGAGADYGVGTYGGSGYIRISYEDPTALATAAELAKVPKSDSTVTFNDTALASIKSQAVAALDDVNVELDAIPDTTGSIRRMVQFLFQLRRNKVEQTHYTQTIYKENGSTPLGESALIDDGSIYTKGKMTTVE